MTWENEHFHTERAGSPPQSTPKNLPSRYAVASYASSQYTGMSALAVPLPPFESEDCRPYSSRPEPLTVKPQPYQYISSSETSDVPLVSPVSAAASWNSPVSSVSSWSASDFPAPPVFAARTWEPVHQAPQFHPSSTSSIMYDNGYGYIAPDVLEQVSSKGKIQYSLFPANSNNQGSTSRECNAYRPQFTEAERYSSGQGATMTFKEDNLFSALFEETKQLCPSSDSDLRADDEHKKLLIQYVLSSSPEIPRAVATIKRARRTAVDRPLTRTHRHNARQGSHLRAGLNKTEAYRRAKGETERNMMHGIAQRIKGVPKYKDVLDDTDRQAITMGARGLWIREWNSFSKLYPSKWYYGTFQGLSRHREGRHLATRKIACSFDDGPIKLGSTFIYPRPTQETLREAMKREERIAKGGIKGAISKLGRDSALAARAPQPAPSQRTRRKSSLFFNRQNTAEEPARESLRGRARSILQNMSNTEKPVSFRGRAKSILQSFSSETSAAQGESFRDRAMSIFPGKTNKRPSSREAGGPRKKIRSFFNKRGSKVKVEQWEAPAHEPLVSHQFSSPVYDQFMAPRPEPLVNPKYVLTPYPEPHHYMTPSQEPRRFKAPSSEPLVSHNLSTPYSDMGNPWDGDPMEGVESHDPCSLNYRRR